tara:strand:- start:11800 stop:12045 length:246 start_codon:yes stop_codon:yes gene_type:complete
MIGTIIAAVITIGFFIGAYSHPQRKDIFKMLTIGAFCIFGLLCLLHLFGPMWVVDGLASPIPMLVASIIFLLSWKLLKNKG